MSVSCISDGLVVFDYKLASSPICTMLLTAINAHRLVGCQFVTLAWGVFVDMEALAATVWKPTLLGYVAHALAILALNSPVVLFAVDVPFDCMVAANPNCSANKICVSVVCKVHDAWIHLR